MPKNNICEKCSRISQCGLIKKVAISTENIKTEFGLNLVFDFCGNFLEKNKE